jgi:Xaa-Pro aminopeptidase
LTSPTGPDWSGRLQGLTSACAELDLGAVVVSDTTNIRYLTGFHGSAGLLLATAGQARLLVDGRYLRAARQQADDGLLGPVRVESVTGSYDESLAVQLRNVAASRVGFEAAHLTVARLATWKGLAGSVEWVPTARLVERRRVVKDEWEIATLKQAAARLSEVAGLLGSHLALGVSERDVARAIDRDLDRAGFSAPAFDTIVASGPNSGLPHARPTDRRLAAGDLVVLDFGGVLDGYCVDLTRMAALRPLQADGKALFLAVRDAQAAALKAVAPGTAGSIVDAAARGVLEARGLGQAFLHGTGHGLGLDVHEAPRLGPTGAGVDEVLEPGMVCTVEPGAYVDGIGGARLEDDVLVTADGCEVLTTAPRGLLMI